MCNVRVAVLVLRGIRLQAGALLPVSAQHGPLAFLDSRGGLWLEQGSVGRIAKNRHPIPRMWVFSVFLLCE